MVEAAAAKGTTSRPLKIFVVENHVDSRVMLTLLLEELGHTVASASSMNEALRELPRTDCDVLISDIGLPDGDGWELLRRVELKKPIFAIATSGFGMKADRDQSHAAGYREHLVKPMALEQLERLLVEAAQERDAADAKLRQASGR